MMSQPEPLFQINDGTVYLGTKCPATKLTIEPTEPMQLHNGKHSYSLEIDEDTHWALVKLGAELRMHQEDYAEQLLKSHCEAELNRETSD
jgi:hypothetical protein